MSGQAKRQTRRRRTEDGRPCNQDGVREELNTGTERTGATDTLEQLREEVVGGEEGESLKQRADEEEKRCPDLEHSLHSGVSQ